MNSLLSLPNWKAPARRSTVEAIRRHDPACRPSARQAMARQLVAAMRADRVSPAHVTEAIKGGDRDIAALLRTLQPALPLPAFKDENRPWMAEPVPAPSVSVPDAMRRQLAGLVRRLEADGDITPDALRTCAADLSWHTVIALTVEGWNNRMRRVLSPLDCLLGDVQPYLASRRWLGMLPNELNALLGGLSGDLNAPEFAEPGIFVEQSDFRAVALPAHPIADPGWFKTLSTAWNGLAQASQCGFVLPVCDDLIYLLGYAGELIDDVVTRSELRDGGFIVSEADITSFDEELGWGRETVVTAVNEIGHVLKAQKSAGKGRGLPRSRQSPAQKKLLARLAVLRSMLIHAPTSSTDWRFEHCDEAQHGVGPLVYVNYGPHTDPMMDDLAHNFYEVGNHVSIFTGTDDPASVSDCWDRAILEAGVACLALAELERYSDEHANEQAAT